MNSKSNSKSNASKSSRPRSENSEFAPPSAAQQLPWFRAPWFWAIVALVLFVVLFRYVNSAPDNADSAGVPTLPHQVLAEYPHDSAAYTQGLVVHDGRLFESTGRFGQSSLREVDQATGNVLRRYDLDENYFGEGLCRWNDQWLMLTWRNQEILVFDDAFEPLASHPWPHEGWGLTHDGKQLIISDGTERLFFVDPTTFEATRFVDVTMNGRSLDRLNELESIDGFIYANVWYRNFIVKIDPANGKVVGKIDLEELRQGVRIADRDAVLNGIAYDPSDQSLLVTGKLWPKLYRIRLSE